VVRPDEEPEHRERDARVGDEAVAEDLLAREGGDDLAHDAHAGQDHDVDGRVRVEPEEVLEEERVPADRRDRRSHVEEPLGREQKDRDRDDGRPEHDDEARRVGGPDEERKAEPGQARARASGGS
jgi:hypothetical protein